MSSSSASEILGDLPPGFHFAPPDEQLVKLYLLRRVRGRPDLFPGLIVDDDTAANTQPWELFDRHGRSKAVPAFFFVHNPKDGARRPDRRCHGGGTWKSQKREKEKPCHELIVDGERVKWSRHNLNLHMKESEGSMGWVMHEYTITTHPSLKLCSIAFSGYGQKRKRVPDGYDGEPATQRPRVDADGSASAASGSGTMTFDQGFSTAHDSEHQQRIMQGSSGGEIAAGMLAEMTTYAQPPTLEFQAEQVQQTMNASASQELQPPPSSWTFNQDSAAGLAQDGAGQEPWELMSQDDITEVLDMISHVPATTLEEQVPLMDQSSCGTAPNIGDTDVVHWEGIDFSFSYDEGSMC